MNLKIRAHSMNLDWWLIDIADMAEIRHSVYYLTRDGWLLWYQKRVWSRQEMFILISIKSQIVPILNGSFQMEFPRRNHGIPAYLSKVRYFYLKSYNSIFRQIILDAIMKKHGSQLNTKYFDNKLNKHADYRD